MTNPEWKFPTEWCMVYAGAVQVSVDRPTANRLVAIRKALSLTRAGEQGQGDPIGLGPMEEVVDVLSGATIWLAVIAISAIAETTPESRERLDAFYKPYQKKEWE